METINVVIADADQERRVSVIKLLFKNPDIEVSGEAESAEECMSMVRDEHPDLLLLNVPLDEETGFDEIQDMVREISLDAPQTEIILITQEMEDLEQVRKLTRMGARDYIVRPIDED
ncbi:MAG: response regulator, partial [bacterium]